MKKRFILTVEIDTDVPEAENWAKISDYVDNEIDSVWDNFKRSSGKNYSRVRPGTAYKVSLKTVKKLAIKDSKYLTI